ncbi:MAG TPA: lipoyl(octanoyl) transferase LipB [Solirubrobacteraceae bacterium]|jgi:lipoyl(octanoyl) transferase|nr:lipoyl(octanoyl) transferase LipB [Solirubrobacteraceae bacterium]
MSGSANNEMWVCELGMVPYPDALALQEDLRERRIAELVPDTLLLLEHPPVYTRGRRSADGELLHDEAFYRARGIDVVGCDRGGRITYHGPGQLVGYPVMRIADVGAYLRAMESAIVAALAVYGVGAHSRCDEGSDFTGVWVAQRKIASIGVHVSHGVTTHGFAINVSNDLEPFDLIVACGLPGVTMTTLQRELAPARALGAHAFRRVVAREFCAAYSRSAHGVDVARLAGAVGVSPALAGAPT